MAKKDVVDKVADSVSDKGSVNTLLSFLRENDKKNLFYTNTITTFHKTGFPQFDYYFGSLINVHDKDGNLIKQEPRLGQAAGTFNLIVGNTGSGKAQPLTTKIPTPDGYKLMGDLKVGDRVFGSDGSVNNIVGVYPQGVKDVYEITFSDGRKARCCKDHLWNIERTSIEKIEKMTMTLEDIIKSFNEYEYSIQTISGPVQYNHQDISIDPFDIGSDLYIKRIPDVYMYNDYETRMRLLHGFINISKVETIYNTNYIIYDNESPEVLDQLRELIRSLGLTIYYIPSNNNVCFSLDNSESIEIIDIKLVGKEECQCIMVDSFDHLYVTEQFIVTHNTTLAVQIASNIMRQYKNANVIHFDCENRTDISRCENISKLPSYCFDKNDSRCNYILKSGTVALDVIQEMIVKMYVSKMRLKKDISINSGHTDEFGREVSILPPTIIIIDSITTVLNETFSYENSKDVSDAEKMRGNTEGARDAKTLKGFFKDILPLCKEANIIVYGINHINQNMSMNAFTPVAKQQNFLKQDEVIPGGKTMLYYPFNIIKLTARPSDDFSEDIDGFAGHIVMIEPIKSSSNQSGNSSKGISFEMVFSFKDGFDPLRSIIWYAKDNGLLEGNKTRMKFKDNPEYTFVWKNIYTEVAEKPIWNDVKRFVIPSLDKHLPYLEPSETKFDENIFDY